MVSSVKIGYRGILIRPARLLPVVLIAALMTFIPNVVVPTMLSKAHGELPNHQVGWDLQEGTIGGSSARVYTRYTDGEFLQDVPADPVKPGYVFAGWMPRDDRPYVINVRTTSPEYQFNIFGPTGARYQDITVYARWNIPITYNSQGGSAIIDDTVTDSDGIPRSPGTPTRCGYTFIGWFEETGRSAISFPYQTYRNVPLTLFAHWTANSNDANLSNLLVNGGNVSPTVACDTSNYTARVTKATGSATVTATVNQANATIQVNGIPVNSGSQSSEIPLNIGVNNVIRIVVTNKDGATTKTYTVTVTRQTDDATLSALTLSSGTLTPTFASATRTGYTASVSDSSITITPTVNQVNATTVQYLGADGATPFTGALSLGSNVIRTVVTALNGTTTKTYTVTVTRVEDPTDSVTRDNQAAAEAAAKREAEKQAARADITIKLLGGKDLSVEMFAKAEIFGVTTTNIAAVQAELLALPVPTRTDITQVLKVAHKFELVGNIGSDAVNYMQSNSFIEIGLIPADSKNKVSLVYSVRKLPEASRDTYAEIKAAIDAERTFIQARKERLAAVIARNAARYNQIGATK